MLKKYKFEKKDCMGGWYIPKNICDGVIDFYKESEKVKGCTHRFDEKTKQWVTDVNVSNKVSTDVLVSFYEKDERMIAYRKYLQKCLELYVKEYPELNRQPRFNVSKGYNIQFYKPGEGYKAWHCERANLTVTDRLLVFMTYLNNVPDGGTEFMYQNLTTKAEKGLTLIWPADWTHTHRGQISNTKEKYIVTGWYCYLLDGPDWIRNNFAMNNHVENQK